MGGCEGSIVHVAPPQPPNSAVPVCNRLNDQLPNLLEHLQSRPTRPRSPLVHAWGNVHPVVLRCGVPKPVGYTDTSFVATSGDRNPDAALARHRPRLSGACCA